MTPFSGVGKAVTLEEVGLRDGLQGEARLFSVEEKVALARLLMDAGVRKLQIGAFVRPDWVPQMANTEEVFKALPERKDVTYTALVLNETGLERALSAGVTHLYVAASASNAHSLKNLNRPMPEAVKGVARIVDHAKKEGLHVRAGIMVAFGCPFEGPVPVERVLEIAERFADAGADVIDLADTAGLANPKQVYKLVVTVRSELEGGSLSLHLHDTRGLGLANLLAGLQGGVTHFDTSVGGIGGCPFIPHAAGNIPTEDAVLMLEEMGIETGIHLPRLCEATKWLETRLGRVLPAKVSHLPA